MKNRAFTLVELVVVIAILSIIMLIGVPAFGHIVERMQVRSDKASANEIGKALTIREELVSDEKKISYYPVITRYDQLEDVDEFISITHRPQSMKDGYYFVTALMVDNVKKILVGIGKEDMPITDTAYNSPKASGWVYIQQGVIADFLSANGELLDEVVVMPDDYVEEDKTIEEAPKEEPTQNFANLEVGQYVRYEPKVSSYMATSGSSSSTFYPVNTKSWKVYSVNGDRVTLISSDSVGGLTLDGKDGYRDAVSVLNGIAGAYVDNNYVVSARSIGSGADSIFTINEEDNPITWDETYNNGKNGVPYKDGIHKSDRDIIKGNEKLQCNSDIWFASRYIVPTSSHTYFAVRSLGKNNVEGAQSLYIDRKNGTAESLGAPTLGVRVVATLATDVKIVSGSGTVGSPYILGK